jgi:cytochrome b561
MAALIVLLLGTLLINLPFGYWREGVRKFSAAWFVAVHAAVPIIILGRVFLRVEWRLVDLPFMVAAYFGGQFVGARLRRRRDEKRKAG